MAHPFATLQPPGTRTLVGAREILRALVVKELKVKYKRSILGFFWSLITPILLTGVYTFVVIYVWKVDKPDYILFLLSGLLPWNFFNLAILTATSSLVDNGPLIRKVYFPRLLLPLSSILANLINFLMGLVLLIVVLVASGRPVYLQLHWLILAVLLQTALCFGAGLVLSIGNVFFRDIQQLMSILMMVLFFVTPIVYELERVPPQFRGIVLANPLSAVMTIYRAALFDVRIPDLSVVAIGTAEVVVLTALGALLYRRFAPTIAKEV